MEILSAEEQYRRNLYPLTKIVQSCFIFSVLAIAVACLGLYAITALQVAMQRKNLSVRKVMGATLFQVSKVFVRSGFLPILLSLLVAIPGSYLIVDYFVSLFPVRPSLSAMPFLLAVAAMLALALLTVLYHVIKAARTNPAIALKYE